MSRGSYADDYDRNAKRDDDMVGGRRRDDDDRPRRRDDDDRGVRVRGGQVADRGSRFLAALIDSFLSILCMVPGFIIITTSLASFDPQTMTNPLALIEVALAGFLVAFFGLLAFQGFLAYMITQSGQTVGKKVLGIRIVHYETGELPGFVHGWLLRSFVPWLISQIPYIGGLFGLIDVLCIFGSESRCIHDLIATTKVVVATPLNSPTSPRDEY